LAIESLAQTIMLRGRLSGLPGESVVAQTTNTESHMPDFNNLGMDPDLDVINISRNILDHEEPKF
jgi:hypothetical protein